MRKLFFMAGIVLAAAAGCRRVIDPVQVFIPGTYVCAASGEFSVALDTLVIAAGKEDVFMVTRRVGYRVVRGGKLLPEHHLVHYFEALYEPENHILNEFTTGRIFRFDPRKRVLLAGRATYHKLQ